MTDEAQTFSRTKNSKTLLKDGGNNRAYVTAILKKRAWKRRSRTLMRGFWFMLGFRILLGPMLLLLLLRGTLLLLAWLSDMISGFPVSHCTHSHLTLGQHGCSQRRKPDGVALFTLLTLWDRTNNSRYWLILTACSQSHDISSALVAMTTARNSPTPSQPDQCTLLCSFWLTCR